MMMYEFKPSDAYDFARHIGERARKKGDELFMVCPYCRAKHDGDSFSINLKTGQFKCFRASCDVRGNMITLSKDFDFSLGNYYDSYYRPQKQFEPIRRDKEPIRPKPKAIEYLESRGISRTTAERYEITVQTKRENILVFPFRNEKGEMWFAKYRKTDFDKSKDKNKEWCEKGRKPILFGMYQCSLENKTLVLTEGQLDSLSVAESGIENAVSVPTGANGFTWVPYCWEWMQNFDEIIVFGDYEKGHITLLDEISKRFRRMKIRRVREEDYGDCKDANDILRKYGRERVRKCVEDAVAIPIRQVVDLADVTAVDVFNIEKLRTGIRQLDRLLYGGLPFGGVVLVAGKAGMGKSTLASQMVAQAISQGYKVFAYSGELPNYLFRSWLDFQIAGRKHVIEYQNQWGDRRLNVSDTNKSLIANWYRGKCFLYDSSNVEDDEKESLVEVVENAVMQYGIKVVLIDNLMTALDLDGDRGYDKYDKQSLFVKKLARMALAYDVLILLVAHKRKNSFSQNDNDEVAGSSDVTNLGTVTISYDTGEKIEPTQRLLKVSKNRLFGKVETRGFVMDFDEKSKRIYGLGDDVDFDFGWNPNGEWERMELDDGDAPFEL